MIRYFAIGDIHGHYNEAFALVEQIKGKVEFTLEKDHLLFLGDLVDNGPNAKEVIQWCIDMKTLYPETFHPIMGNHDHMMVDSLVHNSKHYGDYYLWHEQGGKQTIASYLPQNVSNHDMAITQILEYIPKEHLEFLEKLPRYWETDKYFFVHAGIPPHPLSEIPFDDPDVQEDLIWIRNDFYNSNIDFGKKIIFAHSPFEQVKGVDVSEFEPYEKDNMIGINTMPRNDGKLTCVTLNSDNDDYEFFFQKKL